MCHVVGLQELSFRVRARNIVKLKLMNQGDVTVSIRVD